MYHLTVYPYAKGQHFIKHFMTQFDIIISESFGLQSWGSDMDVLLVWLVASVAWDLILVF